MIAPKPQTREEWQAEADRLRGALEAVGRVLGPTAPDCEGCAVEIHDALMIVGAAIGGEQ